MGRSRKGATFWQISPVLEISQNPHATPGRNRRIEKVKLHKFTVDPLKVAPYATVTATWDVTVPETGFEIVIRLNGQEVSTVGTKTFKLATQGRASP